MSSKKYPIPAYPPGIGLTFESMCRSVSTEVTPFLLQQMKLFESKLTSWEQKMPPHNLKMGYALIERAHVLLKRFDSLNERQRSLAAAAIQYAVREQDGIVDNRPVVGFEDDVKVMNHVLEELALDSYFILPSK